MLVFAALLCLTGIAAFAATSAKARTVRGDEARMAGYIASLKAVAADQRARIADLELSLAGRDQVINAQERLIDGQATHLRTLDTRYVG